MNGAQRTFRYKTASAILTPLGNGSYLLRNVWAGQRGLGHGRAVMNKVIAHANEKGITLVLVAQAYGPARQLSMTAQELVSWYERCGFVTEDTRPPYRMVRTPRLSDI